MRILFITSSRIGDAVLSTGLLDHLLRTHPTARFTIACGPVASELFTHMPNLERLIIFDKKRHSRHWLSLWWQCVFTPWHLVVDIRASAIAYLLPTRHRAIMRKRPGHKTTQLAAILNLTPPPLPVTWTSPEDRSKAETLLPPGPPIIALGPTANWPGKVWPPERFATLAKTLQSTILPNARIAILAGPGPQEAALATPLLTALPNAINFTGTLTLSEAAAVLARATIFIGNDSGLMHLAAAAGTPTIGLFGPTNAAEYSPAGHTTAIAVSPTSSMTDLTVLSALDAVERLLGVGEQARRGLRPSTPQGTESLDPLLKKAKGLI